MPKGNNFHFHSYSMGSPTALGESSQDTQTHRHRQTDTHILLPPREQREQLDMDGQPGLRGGRLDWGWDGSPGLERSGDLSREDSEGLGVKMRERGVRARCRQAEEGCGHLQGAQGWAGVTEEVRCKGWVGQLGDIQRAHSAL